MSRNNVTALLHSVKDGDKGAFERLYTSTRRGVYAFLYSYLHNSHDSEDAMHAVYIRVKENIHTFQNGTNGRAWLLQIAKNYALNVIKKQSRTLPLDDYFDTASTKDDFSEGSITYAMQKVLSEEEQRIITLHVLWGYKHRELSKILDMPTGTITSKYKRAIDKLKKELKEEGV